jgi:hypothetical protein
LSSFPKQYRRTTVDRIINNPEMLQSVREEVHRSYADKGFFFYKDFEHLQTLGSTVALNQSPEAYLRDDCTF